MLSKSVIMPGGGVITGRVQRCNSRMRRDQLRSTIEPVVLSKIYELAGTAPPPAGTDRSYPGYPLAAPPRGAALLFYLAWPLAAGLAFVLFRGRWRSSCGNLV